MLLHYENGCLAVHGIEGERGGFSRHPMCNLCEDVMFYGEDEFYPTSLSDQSKASPSEHLGDPCTLSFGMRVLVQE